MSDKSNASASMPTSNAPSRLKASEKAYQSEMMFLGERCQWDECHRESFLPFRCPDCQHQFCSDHYKTMDHHCSKASATFLVPLCPLCHEPPKNWRRDQDPNIAMDAHLTPQPRTGQIECSALDEDGVVRQDVKGRPQRTKRPNECNDRRCKKLMVVPIQCPSCRQQFCPSHRAQVQHSCGASQKADKPQPTSSLTSNSLSARFGQLRTGGASATSSSSATTSSSNTQSHKGDATSMTSRNPLQVIGEVHKEMKMDKRARSEQQSALKALQARHSRGLLSPAEEVRLAEAMAQSQESRKRKDECFIM